MGGDLHQRILRDVVCGVLGRNAAAREQALCGVHEQGTERPEERVDDLAVAGARPLETIGPSHLRARASAPAPSGAAAGRRGRDGGWLPTTDVPLSQAEPTLALAPGIARHDGAVLFLVGEQDALIPGEQRAMSADALRAAGVRHDVVVYPDAAHGFCCEETDTFDHAASADARRRIEHLLAAEIEPAVPGLVRLRPGAAR